MNFKKKVQFYRKKTGSPKKANIRTGTGVSRGWRKLFVILAVMLFFLGLALPTASGQSTAFASTANEVYSFGNGAAGQLGDGTKALRFNPIRIQNLVDVKEISAGRGHSLVLLENGDVYSFGWNKFGQLGHGDTSDRYTPTRIAGLSNAKAISAGEWHSLVLLENGDVYSFGACDYGQLGHGDTTHRQSPTRISGISRAADISAGPYHSLVLLENGDVYSFGGGSYGQLGHGDYADRHAPSRIAALSNAGVVSAGGLHSLVVLNNGELYSFGWNSHGQLGQGDTIDRNTPTRVTGLRDVKAVANNKSFSLATLENGEVYSFGGNLHGVLGHGDTRNRHVPTRITGLAGAKAVAAGGWHSLVLLENGEVYSFGWGEFGQLGLGNNEDQHTPTRIAGLRNAGAVAASSGGHSLVLVEKDAPPPPAAPRRYELQGEIVQGRFLVPMRAIFEALGTDISWDGETRTVTGTKGNVSVRLTIDSNIAVVNNETLELDVPATIIEGRTFVPARLVGEALGAKVRWDEVKRLATITQEEVVIEVLERPAPAPEVPEEAEIPVPDDPPQPEIQDGGMLKGVMVCADSKQPVVGAAMVLSRVVAERVCRLQADLVATTGQDGSFQFNNVPPGTYVLLHSPTGEGASLWPEIDGLTVKYDLLGATSPLNKILESREFQEFHQAFSGGGRLHLIGSMSFDTGHGMQKVTSIDGAIASEKYDLQMEFRAGMPLSFRIREGQVTEARVEASGL